MSETHLVAGQSLVSSAQEKEVPYSGTWPGSAERSPEAQRAEEYTLEIARRLGTLVNRQHEQKLVAC